MFGRNSPTDLPNCPLCDRKFDPDRVRPLYGTPVCKRCNNRFARRRQAAWFLDSLLFFFVIVTAVEWVVFEIVPGTAEPRSTWAGEVVYQFANWILLPLIFCFKDGFSGMSPGKWLNGLQVIDRTTRAPIGLMTSLRRNLVTMIPIAVPVIAFQLRNGPRWGDRWADTMVVWRRCAHKLPFDRRGVLCIHCGYNLTGNVSGRCPECGVEMSPPAARAVG